MQYEEPDLRAAPVTIVFSAHPMDVQSGTFEQLLEASAGGSMLALKVVTTGLSTWKKVTSLIHELVLRFPSSASHLPCARYVSLPRGTGPPGLSQPHWDVLGEFVLDHLDTCTPSP